MPRRSRWTVGKNPGAGAKGRSPGLGPWAQPHLRRVRPLAVQVSVHLNALNLFDRGFPRPRQRAPFAIGLTTSGGRPVNTARASAASPASVLEPLWYAHEPVTGAPRRGAKSLLAWLRVQSCAVDRLAECAAYAVEPHRPTTANNTMAVRTPTHHRPPSEGRDYAWLLRTPSSRGMTDRLREHLRQRLPQPPPRLCLELPGVDHGRKRDEFLRPELDWPRGAGAADPVGCGPCRLVRCAAGPLREFEGEP